PNRANSGIVHSPSGARKSPSHSGQRIRSSQGRRRAEIRKQHPTIEFKPLLLRLIQDTLDNPATAGVEILSGKDILTAQESAPYTTAYAVIPRRVIEGNEGGTGLSHGSNRIKTRVESIKSIARIVNCVNDRWMSYF
ncbi:MAG: hypothetical protein ACRERS_06840, partial [Methylococcales bacterium]